MLKLIKKILNYNRNKEYEKEVSKYKKEVSEKADRMQDWIFPIMTVVSLGGIEKNLEVFKKEPWLTHFFVGLYGFIIVLVLLGLYVHIKENVKISEATDVSAQFQNYEKVFYYFITYVLDFAFWILIITLILNYIAYVKFS